MPGLPPGREGLKAFSSMLAEAFSSSEVTVDDLVSEGDKVVTRWSAYSVHSGEFMNIQATGKKVRASGIDVVRIQDGKIVESWSESDMMGLMQQLGVGPPPG